MDNVYELEFVGRGGQGAKTAAELVAKILLNNGKNIQSFPDYGPERKGAPVRAFTRFSDKEIRSCSSESNPNVIIIIDPTLVQLNNKFFEAKDDQIIIINSSKDSSSYNFNVKAKVYTVNATNIAMDILKSNITNSAMLGALSKVTQIFTLEEIKEEFRKEFEKKLDHEIIENNFKAIDRAFNEVK